MEFILEHWDSIAGLVCTLLAFLLGLPKVSQWRAKAVAMVQAYHLTAAKNLAFGCASDVYVHFVRSLKESGEWNAEAKARAFTKALDALKARVSADGLQVAQEVLPALIEIAVAKLKKSNGKEPVLVPLSAGPELL